jgi:hypothetical protein
MRRPHLDSLEPRSLLHSVDLPIRGLDSAVQARAFSDSILDQFINNGGTLTFTGASDLGNAGGSTYGRLHFQDSPNFIYSLAATGLVADGSLYIGGQVTGDLSGVASLQAGFDPSHSVDASIDLARNFGMPNGLASQRSTDGLHSVEFVGADFVGNLSSPGQNEPWHVPLRTECAGDPPFIRTITTQHVQSSPPDVHYALAVLELLADGSPDSLRQARIIGDTLVWATLQRDQIVYEGLFGQQHKNLEKCFAAGDEPFDAEQNTWVIVALLSLHIKTGEQPYLDTARHLGGSIQTGHSDECLFPRFQERLADQDEPVLIRKSWSRGEPNIDVCAPSVYVSLGVDVRQATGDAEHKLRYNDTAETDAPNHRHLGQCAIDEADTGMSVFIPSFIISACSPGEPKGGLARDTAIDSGAPWSNEVNRIDASKNSKKSSLRPKGIRGRRTCAVEEIPDADVFSASTPAAMFQPGNDSETGLLASAVDADAIHGEFTCGCVGRQVTLSLTLPPGLTLNSISRSSPVRAGALRNKNALRRRTRRLNLERELAEDQLPSSVLPISFCFTNADNSDPGAFRCAINDVNPNSLTDTVSIGPEAPDLGTISQLSAMPAVTHVTAILDYPSIEGIGGSDGTPGGANALDSQGSGSSVFDAGVTGFGGSETYGTADSAQISQTQTECQSGTGIAIASNNDVVSGNPVVSRIGDGIEVDGSYNQIGVAAGAYEGTGCNAASWNGDQVLYGSASRTSGNMVESNSVGTDSFGPFADGSGSWGVLPDYATDNLITDPVIFGIDHAGMGIRGAGPEDTLVQPDYIGTGSITGMQSLGNGYSGIYFGEWGDAGDAPSNVTIGGTATGAEIVISGGDLALPDIASYEGYGNPYDLSQYGDLFEAASSTVNIYRGATFNREDVAGFEAVSLAASGLTTSPAAGYVQYNGSSQGNQAAGASDTRQSLFTIPNGYSPIGQTLFTATADYDPNTSMPVGVLNDTATPGETSALAQNPGMAASDTAGLIPTLPGMHSTFEWTLTNTGSAIAIVPWTESVFLVGGAGGAEPTVRAARSFSASPAAGPSVSRSITVEALGMPPGSYGLQFAEHLPGGCFEVDTTPATYSKVTGNTPTTSALTVSFLSNVTSKLTVQASATIPPGAHSSSFPVTVINFDWIDGNGTAAITASASGLRGRSANASPVDDLCAFEEAGSPRAQSAFVDPLNPCHNTVIIESGMTGANVAVTFTSVPAGLHDVQVAPPGHSACKHSFVVVPGITNSVEVRIAEQLVANAWTVVATTIHDTYQIQTTVATYDGGGRLTAGYAYAFGVMSQVNASSLASYYDLNIQGSSSWLKNTPEPFVNRYTYHPLDQITTINARIAHLFTFIGQFSASSYIGGLLSMRARHYDLPFWQCLSNDPLYLASNDTNIQKYPFENPVAMIDPAGERCYHQWKSRPINDDPRETDSARPTGDIAK